VPLLYFARCAGSGETHGNQHQCDATEGRGAEERGSRDPSRQPAPQPVGCGRQEVIRSAKNRGYVAHDQINSVLPSEEVNSEQIEGVLADETE
jgi:RNA polymerase primary sigma factor